MTMTRDIDARFHRNIEDAITFLLLCERGFGVGKMEFFDGALLSYASVLASISDACRVGRSGAPDSWQIASAVPKIRGSMIMGSEDPQTRMIAVGASELDVIAKRKLAARPIGRMAVTGDATHRWIGYDPFDPRDRIVEVRAVAIAQSGAARSLCQNYFIRDRRRRGGVDGWSMAARAHEYAGEDGIEDYDSLGLTVGACAASVSRLWWRVLLRFGGQKPGIQLFTDATGIKDFFKFREIAEGKARRDALVHWVTDHWRQNRVDPDVENYVREHLRGARTFDWHNLSGTIELPEPEIEREQAAVVKRHRMRRDELDRRLRAARRG